MSPEVLIYIQSIRNFLKNDETTRTYFLNEIDEELFLSHVAKVAQKNFEKDGEVMLTQSQFEDIRNNLLTLIYNKKQMDEILKEVDERIIFDAKDHGVIFLN